MEVVVKRRKRRTKKQPLAAKRLVPKETSAEQVKAGMKALEEAEKEIRENEEKAWEWAKNNYLP